MTHPFKDNAHRGDPHSPGEHPDSGFYELRKGLVFLAPGIELVEPKTDAGATRLMAMAKAVMGHKVNASMLKAELERIARSLHLDPKSKNKGQIVALIKGA